MDTKRARRAAERVAALMTRQHGVVHRRQALDNGMSERQVDHRLAYGSWVVVHPCVFATSGTPHTTDLLTMAAMLAVRFARRKKGEVRQVAVAGRSASRLWQMDLEAGPERVELVVPASDSCPVLSGVTIHRSRHWDDRAFVKIGAFRVTARADTLVDLADQLDDAALLTLLQAQGFGRPELLAEVARRARPGRPGTPRLVRVLGRLAKGIDSVLHQRGVAILVRAGLPKPECGIELAPGAGESDCVVRRRGAKQPPYGFCMEFDGLAHLRDPRKQRHDRFKDRLTHRTGYTPTFRFTWADIDDPTDMLATVAEECHRLDEIGEDGDVA